MVQNIKEGISIWKELENNIYYYYNCVDMCLNVSFFNQRTLKTIK